ncbi:hypothetical protein ACIPL1_09630 [Pseudomonas sp. NPDC090202]|uniref:hypothetical protein n=1 Tax=unclassified Pseudomonas TaxID=196821 RepID=UPI0038188E82
MKELACPATWRAAAARSANAMCLEKHGVRFYNGVFTASESFVRQNEFILRAWDSDAKVTGRLPPLEGTRHFATENGLA